MRAVNSTVAQSHRFSYGKFSAMWGIVLWMALVTAPDPIRMGIAILLISRPRPLLNLLAFWLGGMAAGMVAGFGALLLLHDSLPGRVHGVTSTLTGLSGGHTQIAIGVLFLVAAAVGAVRLARQRARALIPGGGSSASMPQQRPPTALSELWNRVRNTLESGNPWVAFVVGLGQATPPVQYLAALTAIIASGAAIGAQLSAAVAFTVVVLMFVEVPLISYLVAPARTEAITLQANNWMRAHSRQIFVVGAGVMGGVMVAKGMGVV